MEEEDNQIKINKKSLKDDLKNIYINKRKKKGEYNNEENNIESDKEFIQKRGTICICVADSHCCTAETDTAV